MRSWHCMSIKHVTVKRHGTVVMLCNGLEALLFHGFGNISRFEGAASVRACVSACVRVPVGGCVELWDFR